MLLAASVADRTKAPPTYQRARSAKPVGATTGSLSRPRDAETDQLSVAASLDVLAACLSSGMAVATAAAAAGGFGSASAGRCAQPRRKPAGVGCRSGGGVVVVDTWSLRGSRAGDALLRLARRSASSGAALAHGVGDWPTSHARSLVRDRRRRRAGRGVDRRAARPVLSTGVRVPRHRAGRRRAGR